MPSAAVTLPPVVTFVPGPVMSPLAPQASPSRQFVVDTTTAVTRTPVAMCAPGPAAPQAAAPQNSPVPPVVVSADTPRENNKKVPSLESSLVYTVPVHNSFDALSAPNVSAMDTPNRRTTRSKKGAGGSGKMESNASVRGKRGRPSTKVAINKAPGLTPRVLLPKPSPNSGATAKITPKFSPQKHLKLVISPIDRDGQTTQVGSLVTVAPTPNPTPVGKDSNAKKPAQTLESREKENQRLDEILSQPTFGPTKQDKDVIVEHVFASSAPAHKIGKSAESSKAPLNHTSPILISDSENDDREIAPSANGKQKGVILVQEQKKPQLAPTKTTAGASTGTAVNAAATVAALAAGGTNAPARSSLEAEVTPAAQPTTVRAADGASAASGARASGMPTLTPVVNSAGGLPKSPNGNAGSPPVEATTQKSPPILSPRPSPPHSPPPDNVHSLTDRPPPADLISSSFKPKFKTDKVERISVPKKQHLRETLTLADGAKNSIFSLGKIKAFTFLMNTFGPDLTVVTPWLIAKTSKRVTIQAANFEQHIQLVKAKEVTADTQFELKSVRENTLLFGVAKIKKKRNDKLKNIVINEAVDKADRQIPDHGGTFVKVIQVKDKKGAFSDSRKGLFSFSGASLPDRIRLGENWEEVEEYHFPARHCQNCCSYEHSFKSCIKHKIASSKCGWCSGPHRTSECKSIGNWAKAKCAHCTNGKHPVWSVDCPHRRRERDVNRVRAGTRLTRTEALNILLKKQFDFTARTRDNLAESAPEAPPCSPEENDPSTPPL